MNSYCEHVSHVEVEIAVILWLGNQSCRQLLKQSTKIQETILKIFGPQRAFSIYLFIKTHFWLFLSFKLFFSFDGL